ncbi:flavodoxin family protein [uncultured Dysosmobacter sp.]|uniref:flavodoxin family protein n=1 Tax=uncultured Dysosmobacter sp. TaxID=2591384 RepID=UPI002623E268|nr:flavodoxin family protein [uncultured Dysosmobacter sp.]
MILNGSPRAQGNTAALVAAFTEGTESAGHTVSRFDLGTMDIHGCQGCYGGGKAPDYPCAQRDDMDQIYPAYMAADVVVLASPIYYGSITGQLKCALDRLFAVAELGPNYASPTKNAVLLMAAKGSTEENFAPVRTYYEFLQHHMGWKNTGIVYAGDNFSIGDIQRKPEQLEAARKLGAAI